MTTPPPTQSEILNYADQMANKYGIDGRIFRNLLQQESGLRHYDSAGGVIVGDSGKSVGIGQMKIGAAQDVGMTAADRYDVFKNIEGSAKYLRMKIDEAGGNYQIGLAAYNQGMAGVKTDPQARQKGLQYATRVMGGTVLPPSDDKTIFGAVADAITPSFMETEEGSFFPRFVVNGALIVVGLGVIVLALSMTGKQFAGDFIKEALGK